MEATAKHKPGYEARVRAIKPNYKNPEAAVRQTCIRIAAEADAEIAALTMSIAELLSVEREILMADSATRQPPKTVNEFESKMARLKVSGDRARAMLAAALGTKE